MAGDPQSNGIAGHLFRGDSTAAGRVDLRGLVARECASSIGPSAYGLAKGHCCASLRQFKA
jgi:hypothetical protein